MSPSINCCIMYVPLMKPQVHLWRNIKAPSDLFSPKWRRSCSCWFFMPHSICFSSGSLASSAYVRIRLHSVHRPENVRNVFLIDFKVLEFHDILAMLELQRRQGASVGWSPLWFSLKYLNNCWMCRHDIWLWRSSNFQCSATMRFTFVPF